MQRGAERCSVPLQTGQPKNLEGGKNSGKRKKVQGGGVQAKLTFLGLPNFFNFLKKIFVAGSNPALADTSVIKSDISDTLGCAREVTSSKAFIIRCMTDLNIYKIGFNN